MPTATASEDRSVNVDEVCHVTFLLQLLHIPRLMDSYLSPRESGWGNTSPMTSDFAGIGRLAITRNAYWFASTTCPSLR